MIILVSEDLTGEVRKGDEFCASVKDDLMDRAGFGGSEEEAIRGLADAFDLSVEALTQGATFERFMVR